MSDAAQAAASELLRIRKERVHSTMLIELLVLLVFLSMAFAFVTKDENSASLIQEQLKRAQSELKAAKAEISRLKAEVQELTHINEELRESLARWMERPRDSIPAADQPIVVPRSQIRDLTDRLANAEAMLRERQTENGALRGQLAVARGGGTDLPRCTVTSGFLIGVEMLGNGQLRVTPQWAPGAAAAVRAIPGASELSGTMTTQRFSALASQVQDWGRAQATPCGFRVQVTERHSNLDLYKRQVRVVERYFYVRRN